ncbi:MAG TPA: hypothetical protein VLK79_16745 [Gaiellales bacterium]|nr:hypothetical protein [Gaiellales bacterium]
MWNPTRSAVAVMALGAVVIVAATGTSAVAATTPTKPPGYKRVFTDPIPIPSSQFDFGGQATCPLGTVLWGGGAGFSGGFAGHGENINSSAPAGTSWRARYNNSGPTLGDHFAVEAICAKQPVGYTVAFSTADNPAHSQSAAVATCPTGTVLLSGGGQSTADTADVLQLSAFPLGPHRFKVVMWNGSNGDQRLSAFAVCGKQPPRYLITNSTSTDLGGPANDSGGVVCPAGSGDHRRRHPHHQPAAAGDLGRVVLLVGKPVGVGGCDRRPGADHHHHLGHLRGVGRPAALGTIVPA